MIGRPAYASERPRGRSNTSVSSTGSIDRGAARRLRVNFGVCATVQREWQLVLR